MRSATPDDNTTYVAPDDNTTYVDGDDLGRLTAALRAETLMEPLNRNYCSPLVGTRNKRHTELLYVRHHPTTIELLEARIGGSYS